MIYAELLYVSPKAGLGMREMGQKPWAALRKAGYCVS
jgi:hypothetical protein